MLETVSYRFVEDVSRLNSPSSGGARTLQLPPHLPDPLYITGAEIFVVSAMPTTGVQGVFNVLLDIGGRHWTSIGKNWPASEQCGVTDLNCGEQIYRLCVLDFQAGLPRQKLQPHTPPVKYSRVRGDRIFIDSQGSSPLVNGEYWPIQFCWSIYYQLDSPSSLPNCETALGQGTWGNTPLGAGGRTINPTPNGPNAWFKFTAASTATLTALRLRVLALRTKEANVTVQLYAADQTTAIGSAGPAQYIDAKGDYALYFGSGANVTSGTAYWAKVNTGALDVDIDTVANAGHNSERGGNTLPNSEDWRMDIV